jgi:hypothetical protein
VVGAIFTASRLCFIAVLEKRLRVVDGSSGRFRIGRPDWPGALVVVAEAVHHDKSRQSRRRSLVEKTKAEAEAEAQPLRNIVWSKCGDECIVFKDGRPPFDGV